MESITTKTKTIRKRDACLLAGRHGGAVAWVARRHRSEPSRPAPPPRAPSWPAHRWGQHLRGQHRRRQHRHRPATTVAASTAAASTAGTAIEGSVRQLDIFNVPPCMGPSEGCPSVSVLLLRCALPEVAARRVPCQLEHAASTCSMQAASRCQCPSACCSRCAPCPIVCTSRSGAPPSHILGRIFVAWPGGIAAAVRMLTWSPLCPAAGCGTPLYYTQYLASWQNGPLFFKLLVRA